MLSRGSLQQDLSIQEDAKLVFNLQSKVEDGSQMLMAFSTWTV